jgi:hypothetical protein
MTTTIVNAGYVTTAWSPEQSHAQGADAREIREAISRVRRNLDEAQTRGDAFRTPVRDEVLALLHEAGHPGWDGYQAAPVSAEAVANTLTFIDLLPSDMPGPDVVPEPDGEIALEWYKTPGWVLSISIGPRNRLTYAGLFGQNKIYGAEDWHTTIPRVVTEAMRRFVAAHVAP